MKTHVKFDNVSKEYRLGLTRTSLPAIIGGWVKSQFSGKRSQSTKGGSFWALKDVSFELKEGQSLALIGENGAGKTTALKLLANITKPSRGTITTNGQLSALIELGAGFHPDLTGRENIFLNGTILGLSRAQITRRFDKIVSFSEIERFIDTPVKRYSSGMIVRLGFSVASCIEPEILLVDEVLAVGDAAFQQKCMGRIRSLLKNGTSIIFVSHNFYLVQAVCSRAIYLEKGQVKQRGQTKDIIDLYESDLHQKRALRLEGESIDKNEHADQIEILGVDIAQTGAADSHISNDQPLHLIIRYIAYEDIGPAHVSVFINRADGLTCCMMRTKIDQYPLQIWRGEGQVSLTIDPLQLVSGSYFAEAWFLNESDSMVVTTHGGRSDWFTVKGRGLSYADDSGIFEPNTRWHHATKQTLSAEEQFIRLASD